MADDPAIRTERLLLRRWRGDDLAPFAAMNADREVMEYFPDVLSAEQSEALAARADASFDRCGYGLYAVEVVGGPPFVGFVGLHPLEAETDLPFRAEAEVGWRLARAAWGHGYATEAARACLCFGFQSCGLGEIVSFTSVANRRSEKVMERIGLERDHSADFDHPRVEAGHHLRPHVLYRLSAPAWRRAGAENRRADEGA